MSQCAAMGREVRGVRLVAGVNGPGDALFPFLSLGRHQSVGFLRGLAALLVDVIRRKVHTALHQVGVSPPGDALVEAIA